MALSPGQTVVAHGRRGETAKNLLYTGVAQAWRVGMGFVFTVITARLLAPSDFGLIAMVATATALISLVQDLGATQAVIQRDRIDEGQLSALFWISVALGLVLAMLLGFSAPAIAAFFSEPRLERLTVAFAVLIAVTGLQAIPFALLNRWMRFRDLAIIDALAVTANFVVGVGLAWQMESYWALYAAAGAAAIFSLVGCWIASGFIPGKPTFNDETRAMIGFGSGVSGFNIANYLSRHADKILIGKVFGGGPLGLYDRAYRLLLFPLSQIHAPMGRVMIPLLSRTQSDPERYRRAYMECVSLLLAATQPGILFATVFAADVFRILMGEQWMDSAPIFTWLGVCGLHQIMTSTVGWLYISQGRGGDFFRIGVFGAVTTVLSFVAGLKWGPVGVAASYAISDYIVRLPVIWASVGRRGPVSTRDLYTMAMPHAVATICAAGVLLAIKPAIKSPDVLSCALLLGVTYAVYLAFVLLFPEKRAYLLHNVEFIRGYFVRRKIA
jgi:PST family polysaccharide transporter